MKKRKNLKGNGKATAIYMRISTAEQRHDSQRHDLRAYAENHGYKNVYWFTDTISGAADRLPALDDLDRAVFRGEVQRVVVWALDRVSRKGIVDGLTRLHRWIAAGVEFVCLSLPWDFSGPFAELLAAFCFELAKWERLRIAARTKAGMRAAAAKGKVFGRRKGQRPKWSLAKRKVDPALAKSLRKQGVPVRDIARRFNVSRVAVYAALRTA